MDGRRGPGRNGVDPRLDAEIEDLERRIEALKGERAAARRRRAAEPIADHGVGASEGTRRPSELFGPHDDLLPVHNMGRTCAYCTLWADGFVGLLPHLARRAEFGRGDDYCAVWPLFELLQGGAQGWSPRP